jgi:hypothetical protein
MGHRDSALLLLRTAIRTSIGDDLQWEGSDLQVDFLPRLARAVILFMYGLRRFTLSIEVHGAYYYKFVAKRLRIIDSQQGKH